jgi:hypothetical protein
MFDTVTGKNCGSIQKQRRGIGDGTVEFSANREMLP